MANKTLTTRLKIKAVDQYTPIVKGMSRTTGRFADGVRRDLGKLQHLRGPLRLIEDFRKQRDVVNKSAEALNQAQTRVHQLKKEILATEAPTAKMRREFDRARKSAQRLEERHRKNRTTLHDLQKQLRAAKVNTGDLAGEQDRLSRKLDAAAGPFNRQIERMQRLAKMQDRITKGRERMDRSLARAANVSFVGSASMMTGRRILRGASMPIAEAIEFESAMSDVRKVVDFESPDGFKQMSDDILKLSTTIPMTAAELAAIVAAGGQSGIANDELTQFAELAAKIGVAFDISADQSGTAIAKIKTAMNLDLDQTSSLFDAMNHLSNNSAARADQTLNFLNRAGGDGAKFGFDSTSTLAIGAAMIAAGAGADTAATSFRNMGRALTKGESATKRQSAAYARLGLDAVEVSKNMQADAVGTTMDVLRRLNELPKHLQASVMSDLFGDEARELTKLINNMELMPQMLGMVADQRNYLGSAEAEYAERAKTTANNLQLLRNQTSRLGISIGEVVLPHLNELVAKAQVMIDHAVTWTKANPKLTKTLVTGSLALGAMAVAGGALLSAAAGLIGTMAVLRFGMTMMGARALFARGGLLGLAGQFLGLGKLKKFRLASLLVPVKWGAKLIKAIPWLGLAGGLKWSSLIKPLVWLGRGALRFIPVIGWAALAGELLWRFLIKPLGWDKYLPSIDWGRVWNSFSWEGWLPEVDWSEFVSAISWPDWISKVEWSDLLSFGWKSFINPISWATFIPKIIWNNWLRFAWPDVLPKWDWSAIIPSFDLSSKLFFDAAPSGSSSDPEERAAAVRRGQSLGYAREVTPLAGARAKGGPMKAGLPYLAGELGPEPIFSSKSAFVATHNQLLSMQRAARGIRSAGLAAATAATVSLPALAMPAAAAPAGGAGSNASTQDGGGRPVSLEIGSITITAPSGVSDPRGLVDLLKQELTDEIGSAISAGFSD